MELKIIFFKSRVFFAPVEGFPLTGARSQKLMMGRPTDGERSLRISSSVWIIVDTIHERDGQTDGRPGDSKDRAYA